MKRPGFTLLETILALALTVVVLGLLGMAINVHLRAADASRNEVKASQSARFVLQQMASDLRNAIPVTRAPSSIGSLRGARQELQFDISRMPLLEEMETAAAAAPPSDVRTVVYLVAKPDTFESPETLGLKKRRYGLLRREWERSTFAWAGQQWRTDDSTGVLKVLSPDVAEIEFAYVDGGVEYQEWDSTEKGKLPSAVRIALAVRQPSSKPRRPSADGATEQSPSTIYTALVDLPNARATLDQALAAMSSQLAPASQETKSSDSTGKETKSQDTSTQGTTSGGTTSGGTTSGGTTSGGAN